MNKSYFYIALLLSLLGNSCSSQPILDDDSAVCIAFYNVENLFDTKDDKKVNDNQYLPKSKIEWDEEKYQNKLKNLSQVLFDIGRKEVASGASLIGLAEIENEQVLKDLIVKDSLANRGLKYVHYNSPDKRGIDVALLYNPKKFYVLEKESVPLNGFKKDGKKLYSRDILKVKGVLGTDTVWVFVNHWPSRRAGKEKTAYLRKIAAVALKAQTEKIRKLNPKAKIIVMGDFNDTPEDASIKTHLQTSKKSETVKGNEFYNPFEVMTKNGVGTTPYRGDWFMFDQILFSRELVQTSPGYKYASSNIFTAPYLYQHGGKYDGYILRTFAGGNYLNGYSDHLPVYSILKK